MSSFNTMKNNFTASPAYKGRYMNASSSPVEDGVETVLSTLFPDKYKAKALDLRTPTVTKQVLTPINFVYNGDMLIVHRPYEKSVQRQSVYEYIDEEEGYVWAYNFKPAQDLTNGFSAGALTAHSIYLSSGKQSGTLLSQEGVLSAEVRYDNPVFKNYTTTSLLQTAIDSNSAAANLDISEGIAVRTQPIYETDLSTFETNAVRNVSDVRNVGSLLAAGAAGSDPWFAVGAANATAPNAWGTCYAQNFSDYEYRGWIKVGFSAQVTALTAAAGGQDIYMEVIVTSKQSEDHSIIYNQKSFKQRVDVNQSASFNESLLVNVDLDEMADVPGTLETVGVRIRGASAGVYINNAEVDAKVEIEISQFDQLREYAPTEIIAISDCAQGQKFKGQWSEQYEVIPNSTLQEDVKLERVYHHEVIPQAVHEYLDQTHIDWVLSQEVYKAEYEHTRKQDITESVMMTASSLLDPFKEILDENPNLLGSVGAQLGSVLGDKGKKVGREFGYLGQRLFTSTSSPFRKQEVLGSDSRGVENQSRRPSQSVEQFVMTNSRTKRTERSSQSLRRRPRKRQKKAPVLEDEPTITGKFTASTLGGDLPRTSNQQQADLAADNSEEVVVTGARYRRGTLQEKFKENNAPKKVKPYAPCFKQRNDQYRSAGLANPFLGVGIGISGFPMVDGDEVFGNAVIPTLGPITGKEYVGYSGIEIQLNSNGDPMVDLNDKDVQDVLQLVRYSLPENFYLNFFYGGDYQIQGDSFGLALYAATHGITTRGFVSGSLVMKTNPVSKNDMICPYPVGDIYQKMQFCEENDLPLITVDNLDTTEQLSAYLSDTYESIGEQALLNQSAMMFGGYNPDDTTFCFLFDSLEGLAALAHLTMKNTAESKKEIRSVGNKNTATEYTTIEFDEYSWHEKGNFGTAMRKLVEENGEWVWIGWLNEQDTGMDLSRYATIEEIVTAAMDLLPKTSFQGEQLEGIEKSLPSKILNFSQKAPSLMKAVYDNAQKGPSSKKKGKKTAVGKSVRKKGRGARTIPADLLERLRS